jgi:hypothetical protein
MTFVTGGRGWPALAFLAALILLAREAGAQSPAAGVGDAVEPPRHNGSAVQIDGRLDEDAWASAWSVRLTHQLQPDEGMPPSQETEVLVFYDDSALYLAARVHETEPDRVTERTLERNSFHRQDQDGIGLILDTNGDGRTAFGFIVGPSGVRTDLAVVDEARVSWNTDWNAFWDAASVRHSEGWTTEIRIPFSSLRFEPDAAGEVQMGMILWRYLARSDEFVVFPEVPNDWGNTPYKPAVGVPVVFQGLEPESPLYVKPYLLAGVEQRSFLPDGGMAYEQVRDPIRDLGVDLKYNVTSNLILDLTVNTDFAQVEADDQRFNLERFSVFFPEKRDFFQERADLFSLRLPGGSDRLFHSRRIGIVQGQQVPIRGGARLTGRHGDWEVGVLNMQTDRARLGDLQVEPENFGVVRVQRPVLDRGSYLGGMLTTRSDLDRAHNVMYALDGDLHLGGDHFLGLQAAGSADRGDDPRDGAMGSLVLQRRISRGFSFGSSLTHVGPGFRPAVGFVRRAGMNRLGHRSQYTWFPSVHSRMQNHNLSHRVEFIWDERFRVLETNTSSLTWRLNLRSGASANAQVAYSREVLDAEFQVGELPIPAGRYSFLDGTVGYGSPSGSALRWDAELSGGGYFGGHRVSGSLDLSWTPDPRLAAGVENVVNRIELPAGTEDVLISRLRLGTALNREISATAFVQYNSSARILTPNVRVRYNPREGSDLFVVYNEGLRTSLDPEAGVMPAAPRSQFRSVQVKYTYTFVR